MVCSWFWYPQSTKCCVLRFEDWHVPKFILSQATWNKWWFLVPLWHRFVIIIHGFLGFVRYLFFIDFDDCWHRCWPPFPLHRLKKICPLARSCKKWKQKAVSWLSTNGRRPHSWPPPVKDGTPSVVARAGWTTTPGLHCTWEVIDA